MKKLLKSIKYIISFLFCIILFSCGGETEEEYLERIRQEEAEQAIKDCPEFPVDFQPIFFRILKYYRNDWGPNNEPLVIYIKSSDPFSENDTLGLTIDEDFNYEIKLNHNFINQIDSTTTLDFFDSGKFIFNEFNYTYDGSDAHRDVSYVFQSELDDSSTKFLAAKGYGCTSLTLDYNKKIDDRDSIHIRFGAIRIQ